MINAPINALPPIVSINISFILKIDGILNGICISECPSNSYQTLTSRSENWNSVTYNDGLIFTSKSKILEVNVSTEI
jgi:hypothetical protein